MEEFLYEWGYVIVAIIFVTVVNFGRRYFRGGGLKRIRFRPVKPFFQQVLSAYFSYYKQLDQANQKRFETRVQAFIDSKKFIPRGIPSVTDEMKALIAGSAVQLTFGFKHLNFAHFSRILVYPNDYYSLITRKYHQGEVNPRGLIVLSWRSFEHGYKDEKDGRNLALHEMAHALRLENAIHNEEFDFIPRPELKHFDTLALAEIKSMKKGKSDFFRQYAAVNLHEFFAVAIENFFERSSEFLEEKPELYLALGALLNQDPLRLFAR